jgi:hypothetical protein
MYFIQSKWTWKQARAFRFELNQKKNVISIALCKTDTCEWIETNSFVGKFRKLDKVMKEQIDKIMIQKEMKIG